jgi:glycosyltransferase involved in cell wall biosynthesis
LKLNMVVSALPPRFCGIGDYTARLCRALSTNARVTAYTGAGTPAAIAGVQIESVFSASDLRSVRKIAERVEIDRPDWVVLQFNQFSFGRWGLNPYLPLAMRRIKRTCPETRLAVMFHEDFVPPITWKFCVMRTWQKWQFKALGRAADVVLFSIDPWVEKYRSWFPGKPVLHMPVGSNIPEFPISREDARARLGVQVNQVVLGLFGSLHQSRNLPWVQAAVNAVRAAGADVVVLYVGAQVDLLRGALRDVRVIADGTAEPDEVSRRVRAMDVYLAPFSDGVSSRRTSMMTGLQHGIATVSTLGEFTDQVMARENGRALILSPADSLEKYADEVVSLTQDANRREQVGRQGMEFYRREFDWDVIGRRFMRALHYSSAEQPACSDRPVGSEVTI